MTLREYTNMRRRSGFTLVEVLVSMALILFIMSILAAAFGAASQAVSDLKSAGDLAEKLRGATNVLKRDMEAEHLISSNGSEQLLSGLDLTSWLAPANTPQGFFRIFQQQADQLFIEGSDLDHIPSFHQTGTSLHYTIALNGTRRNDFLTALVPANSPLLSNTDPLLGPTDTRYQDNNTTPEFNSQLAEVAVFLAPTGDQTDGTTGPAQPLFALFRRQFLVVPTGWPATPMTIQDVSPPQGPQYLEMSTVPTAGEPGFPSPPANLTFNTMKDLPSPVRRFWMQRTALNAQGAYYPVANPNRYSVMGEVNPNFQSADLLMADVLSFDVRVLIKGGSAEFVDLFDSTITPFMHGNPGFNQNTGPMVFDTWSNQKDTLTNVDYTTSTTAGALTSAPLFTSGGASISIQAIQITLRVWDFKTKKTRQVTIVQQM